MSFNSSTTAKSHTSAAEDGEVLLLDPDHDVVVHRWGNVSQCFDLREHATSVATGARVERWPACDLTHALASIRGEEAAGFLCSCGENRHVRFTWCPCFGGGPVVVLEDPDRGEDAIAALLLVDRRR